MASRYNKTAVIDNDTEFYSFLRRKRGNIKNLRHQETPVLANPTIAERAAISTTGYIWSYGDRYYNLAHKYYGNADYWWIIAWYNGFPTEADILPGDAISIPLDLEEALMILGVY
tara:strand:+ start:1377 stop:1721 length:345 start_codon:yes stop_codon:yes gene_type:complete